MKFPLKQLFCKEILKVGSQKDYEKKAKKRNQC